MWSQLVITLCLAAGLQAAPERPPDGLSCPRSQGLFSHPSDCHKFLHCDHDYPYVKDCPASLHFNAKLMVCDWPENAGCVPGQPIDPPTPDVPPEPGMECDCECCLKPNQGDCTTFYLCKDGKAYLESCATGLVFNPNIENCDLPSNYQCVTTPRPTTTQKPTTPKPTTPKPTTPKPTTPKPTATPGWVCPTSNGLFPNPKDCHSFYQCSNGHAYLKDCPTNLEFNPVLLVCDWPEHAGCGDPTPAPTSHPAPTPKPNPDVVCPNDTCACRVPNPTDCSQYYQCKDGKAYPAQCPAGLVFNPAIEVCDLPQNVPGCHPSTPKPKPQPTPPPTPGWVCPTSSGLFPNPMDCHSFYQCSNGHAYLMDCPANLEFNPVLLVCDWPEHAGCGDPTPAPTSHPAPTPKPNPDVVCPNDTCACRVPNPSDCNQYYQCKDGKAYPAKCPAGLVFNPAIEVCDLPENVPGCHPTTPKPQPPTPDSSSSSSSESGSGSHHHHHSDSSDSDSKSKHHHSDSSDSDSKSKHHHSDSGDSDSKSKHHHGSDSKHHHGSHSKHHHGSHSKHHHGSKSAEHDQAVMGSQTGVLRSTSLYRNPDHGAVDDDDGFLESQFCPKPNGKFPSSGCRYYYHCIDGIPTKKQCLHGMRFYAPKSHCIPGSC